MQYSIAIDNRGKSAITLQPPYAKSIRRFQVFGNKPVIANANNGVIFFFPTVDSHRILAEETPRQAGGKHEHKKEEGQYDSGYKQHLRQTIRVQAGGKWAEEQGSGELFHQAVYHAYFAEGENIAQIDLLIAIAASVGLNPDEARLALESGRYAKMVDADWRKAGEFGVTAVPTSIYEGKALVGFQEYEAFQQFIMRHNN